MNTDTNPTDTNTLLRSFLNRPLKRSDESIEERMRRWADVANNPQDHVTGESNKAAIAARRKVALQSLRKLIEDNPAVAIKLQRENAAKETA